MNPQPHLRQTLSRLAVFFRECRRDPKRMGAALPSSDQLARAMAEMVPPGEGWVIELGAGTGSITRGLLASGVPPTDLIAIELSEPLADLLKAHHPRIHVRKGNAADLDSLTLDLRSDQRPIRAIVSGLPLRSLPLRVTVAIRKAICRVLANGSLIQFTYDLTGLPFRPLDPLQRVQSRIIWWNVPPARVDRFVLPSANVGNATPPTTATTANPGELKQATP